MEITNVVTLANSEIEYVELAVAVAVVEQA